MKLWNFERIGEILMNWYVNKDVERGYSECRECNDCLHLHQSGFDCDMHLCAICGQHVADKTEFFKLQTGMDK
jgi:hypothetical protein